MTKSLNDNQAGAYPKAGYAWFVVGVLVMATVLSYTDRQILSLLVDPLRHDLGISDTQVGLLMGTAFAVVYGVAGIPFGWLADRSSRRNLIVIGIILWSLGTLACGFSRDFTEIFMARIVVGIGEAVLTPAAISMISDYFPPERRGSATGVFLMGIAMGGGGAILFGGLILRLVDSGLLLGTFLGGESSWRLVLLLLGALGVIPALVISMIKEPKRHHNKDLDMPVTDRKVAGPAFDFGYWLRLSPLFMAVAITSLVDNAVLAWSPSLMIRDFGMAPEEVGTLLGGFLMISGSAGVLAGGFLGDRVKTMGGRGGRIPVAVISAALTSLVTTLIMFGHFWMALAGVTLYIGLSGAGTSVGISALLDLVPNHRRGLVTAVSFFLNVALGAGLGPVAVALAGAHLAVPGSGIGWAIFVVACPCFMLVTVLFYLALRNARKMVAA